VLRHLGASIPFLRGGGRRILAARASAPDFTLDSTEGELTLSRRLLIGAVLLVFYRPGDQRAAARQLSAYRDDLDILDRLGLQVLAANEEAKDIHCTLANEHQLPFPVLSDPGGRVARGYGALDLLGRTRSALIIVGQDRRVRWSCAGGAAVAMRARDLRRATGGLI
jgi:thioredoxin-dependent peroxiredoxin